MTTETDPNQDMVRTLGQTLFFLDSTIEDAEARKAEWDNAREEYVGKARKLLRRMAANGYSMNTAG